MTDEHDVIPNKPDEDDLRFAPPDSGPVMDEDDLQAVDDPPMLVPDTTYAEFEDLTADVDLDAALASISMLDDMLAEQEAAEQAERARVQAEADARAERQERLRNPEHFFPMPSMTTVQRGRMDSVIPALALIGIGAWLTFVLTTGNSHPTTLILSLSIALSLTLLARWLASGRWALGTLFFALTIPLTGGIAAYLLTSGLLVMGWPLTFAGVGLAFLITGVLGGEYRLMLPGLVICFGSLAGLVVTNGLLPAAALSVLASLWPLVVVVIAVLWLLPRFARRG
jgi:hypothetical protein